MRRSGYGPGCHLVEKRSIVLRLGMGTDLAIEELDTGVLDMVTQVSLL